MLLISAIGVSTNALAQMSVTKAAIGCEGFATSFTEDQVEFQRWEARRHGSKVGTQFIGSWGVAIHHAQGLIDRVIEYCGDKTLGQSLSTLKDPQRVQVVSANIRNLPAFRAKKRELARKGACLASANSAVLTVDVTPEADLKRAAEIVKHYDVCMKPAK